MTTIYATVNATPGVYDARHVWIDHMVGSKLPRFASIPRITSLSSGSTGLSRISSTTASGAFLMNSIHL